MNVSLTPALERLVNDKVAGGLYNSASEVVREGLRLLHARDETREAKLDALRADIREGFAAIGRDEHISGPAAFDRLRKERRERRQNGA